MKTPHKTAGLAFRTKNSQQMSNECHSTLSVAFYSCEILAIKSVYLWLLWSELPNFSNKLISLLIDITSPAKLSTLKAFQHLYISNKTKCFSCHTVDERNRDL